MHQPRGKPRMTHTAMLRAVGHQHKSIERAGRALSADERVRENLRTSIHSFHHRPLLPTLPNRSIAMSSKRQSGQDDSNSLIDRVFYISPQPGSAALQRLITVRICHNRASSTSVIHSSNARLLFQANGGRLSRKMEEKTIIIVEDETAHLNADESHTIYSVDLVAALIQDPNAIVRLRIPLRSALHAFGRQPPIRLAFCPCFSSFLSVMTQMLFNHDCILTFNSFCACCVAIE